MWYCTGCNSEVEDDCVTYWEQHDPRCGGCNATCVPERPALTGKDAEIETLRAQVAELNEARNYAVRLLRSLAPQCETLSTVPALLTQIDNWCAGARSDLADALSVLAHKGHDADCPAGRCSFVGFTGRCGESPEWHKQHKVGHEYQSPPCSDACGLERCGVKA